jgi:hypothetical protein
MSESQAERLAARRAQMTHEERQTEALELIAGQVTHMRGQIDAVKLAIESLSRNISLSQSLKSSYGR